MTTITARTVASPEANPETLPFWQAAQRGEFLLRRCSACGRTHWYPRAICPHCFGTELAWEPASGRGTIYAFSPMRRVEPAYVVAYVTLAEGPTMLTNLVDCELESLHIGQAVKLVFTPSENGQPVPMFTPA
ncbi:MAG: OB-fold domain-containing protein [Burkholderiales bacterium]|nr:OB-fold domain-containing protein [Burkholderiales bacterium]